MNFRINYSQLSAEFIIVVVGVAVALAADNWRQGLSDRNLEMEYVERLIAELEFGRNEIGGLRKFLGEAGNGAAALLDQIEKKSTPLDEDAAILNFAYAAKTGGYSDTIAHDLTYRELISTGNLSLIRKATARASRLHQVDNRAEHKSPK